MLDDDNSSRPNTMEPVLRSEDPHMDDDDNSRRNIMEALLTDEEARITERMSASRSKHFFLFCGHKKLNSLIDGNGPSSQERRLYSVKRRLSFSNFPAQLKEGNFLKKKQLKLTFNRKRVRPR